MLKKKNLNKYSENKFFISKTMEYTFFVTATGHHTQHKSTRFKKTTTSDKILYLQVHSHYTSPNTTNIHLCTL